MKILNNLASELSGVLDVMVKDLAIERSQAGGVITLKLTKRNKVARVLIFDKRIVYGGLAVNASDSGILDIENAVIEDFRYVY